MNETDRAITKLAAMAELAKERLRMRNALKAVLLFHSGGPWSEARRDEWKALTGVDEATTRVLCDTRAALGET